MEHLHSPQTQVIEGAYAIKVSMRFAQRNSSPFYTFANYARTIVSRGFGNHQIGCLHRQQYQIPGREK